MHFVQTVLKNNLSSIFKGEKMIRITALMDNKGSEHLALINEHGLSYYIEYNGKRLLFDCGSGPHSQDNAHRLGIDLADLDAVILSHSHYDHAAGYRDLIENGKGSQFDPVFADIMIAMIDEETEYKMHDTTVHGTEN